MRLEEFYDAIVAVSDQWRAELAIQDDSTSSSNFIFPSTGMINPMVLFVRPYIRKDGTMVQGHLRTTPNKFTFDNLSSRKF